MMSWEMALARVASAISPDVIIVVTLEIGSWKMTKKLQRPKRQCHLDNDVLRNGTSHPESPELVNLGRAKFT